MEELDQIKQTIRTRMEQLGITKEQMHGETTLTMNEIKSTYYLRYSSPPSIESIITAYRYLGIDNICFEIKVDNIKVNVEIESKQV